MVDPLGTAPFAGRVPSPAQLGKAKLPPQPERNKDLTRHHCLDTGVGIAFAHVGQLQLLMSYLSDRLCAVDAVRLEVASRATSQLKPGHRPVDVHVQAACREVRARLENQEIVTVEVPSEAARRVGAVIARLRQLDPATSANKHAGEAASIVWAEGRRPRAVVLTNDGAAQKVAGECGVRWHSCASLLRLMVRDDVLGAEAAFELFTAMDAVSGCAGPTPAGPWWFD